MKIDAYSLPKPRSAKTIQPGDQIKVGNRMAIFVRLVVPKREPWAAPTKLIVQFEGNKGTSQIKLSELRAV